LTFPQFDQKYYFGFSYDATLIALELFIGL